MTTVEERWQERLTAARAKMSSAIKPETMAERYSAETAEEIRKLTNEGVREMVRGDNGLLTLGDLDKAEEKLDEAGDYELATDGGIEGGPEYCPCCSVVGEKTLRVGTFKCTNSECRVRHYQQGLPQDAELATDGGQSVGGTEQARLDVGGTRKPIAIKNAQRVTTGDLAALAMCAHLYDPADVEGWCTHDFDDVVRQWICSNVGSVIARLSPHCEDTRGDLPPLHPADSLWVGEADTASTQTTLVTDGGEADV